MRFVSRYQRYSLGIKAQTEMVLATGHVQVMQEQVLADFAHGGIREYEVDEALKVFDFKGLPDGINPAIRLSVYDTELAQEQHSWTDDFRAEVEDILVNRGRLGSDYILVEAPRTPAPWPKYDEAGPAMVLKTVLELGHDPAAVRQYELENANRPDVIAFMERLMVERGDELEDTEVVQA